MGVAAQTRPVLSGLVDHGVRVTHVTPGLSVDKKTRRELGRREARLAQRWTNFLTMAQSHSLPMPGLVLAETLMCLMMEGRSIH